MNWKNVKLVFLREVRDQLRDRRTLFMVAVLPLLLYPALGLGMLQMTLLFQEQTRTVVILAADELPPPALVEGERFRAQYFELPDDAEKLRIVTDTNTSSRPQEGSDPNADVLSTSQQIRDHVNDLVNLEREADASRGKSDPAKQQELDARVTTLKGEVGEAMSAAGIEVMILVPEGLKEDIAEINRKLAEGQQDISDVDTPRLQIVRNSADEKSLMAYRRVREAVENWEDLLLRERLASAHLPESFPDPVNPDQIDLARDQQLAANVWSKLFPAMLIVMAVTGAFYPAVDLGAGEKERGTMETLLISPATRTQIVIGKFFTVLLFSMGTALLNLASMGFTGKYMLSIAGSGQMSQLGDVALPPLTSMIWVLVLAIPLAALFSSLSLGLAMFARSSKEGQYYLTPLLMITMGITVFCLSPAVEITPFYSVVPVMGPALLLKAMLLANAEVSSLYWYAIPVLLTSVGYCALGLWWAIEQFQREDILFRESEQFELRLWIKHLLRDKEPTPSFMEAGICFGMIMLLQLAAMRFMGDATAGLTDEQMPIRMMQLLMIQQLAIIATPALMMGVMLTTNFRKTFKLNWPSLKYVAAAAILAPVLHPLTVELSQFLGQHFFPPLPESAQRAIAPMLDSKQPWWLVLLAFSVAPGICEEMAFRGFILSGFSQRGRIGLAIVLSSVLFGVMHMFPQQVFNAALLGLVLGLMAVRSNSLLPGVLFHMMYNGIEVMRNRIAAEFWTSSPMNWLVTTEGVGQDVQVRYDWPLLVICGVVAGGIIFWLLSHGRRFHQDSVKSVSDTSGLSRVSPA
ncbi:MAG: ABC transporter permease subunit/CPBP intramembrane protease [Planctomycetaceae bacterium]